MFFLGGAVLGGAPLSTPLWNFLGYLSTLYAPGCYMRPCSIVCILYNYSGVQAISLRLPLNISDRPTTPPPNFSRSTYCPMSVYPAHYLSPQTSSTSTTPPPCRYVRPISNLPRKVSIAPVYTTQFWAKVYTPTYHIQNNKQVKHTQP